MPRRTYRTVRAQTIHYLARPHVGVPKTPVGGRCAWRRDDVADAPWSYALDELDVAQVERALERTDVPLERLRAEDVPLPRWASRIAQWRHEITRGIGFVRIRGVPVARWSAAQTERFFWALGQHLGRPGAQNQEGDLLGHVRDLRLGQDGQVRQYKTAEAIPFHCDAADAVGLLCVRPAKQGGISRIASSVAIFDEILRRRPDLAPLLFEPMWFDSRGEGGTDAFCVRPATFDGASLRTFYHGEYLRTAERYGGIPSLTTDQRALLDLYDELAASPDFHVEMELRPGDVQLLSNHTIVHSRTHYEDEAPLERRRHLLRLWLSLEDASGWRERAARLRTGAEVVANLVRRKAYLRRAHSARE